MGEVCTTEPGNNSGTCDEPPRDKEKQKPGRGTGTGTGTKKPVRTEGERGSATRVDEMSN